MKLKSLELQGFKTFPEKTALTFDDGITAVVGPNGSGKSNICDAIRWVLGEQSVKTLRCLKMEGLIFNGTPVRRPQGFAEVTLTIDNTERQLAFDGDMVAITRRYYRSGESEYLINKNIVRLKDINELFMDTGLGRDGYSIIGQGRIDSIVAARSEDRREIFEEAAGISRFRYRKEESENKLAKAEENLVRLRDILTELEQRVEPLRVQAEKARQYLELSEEKRGLEIGLWLNTLDCSGKILREHDDKMMIARNQSAEIEKRLQAIDGEIDRNFTENTACSARIDEIRKEISELEEQAVRKDGEGSVLENDIRHHQETISRLENEIVQASASEQKMAEEIRQKTEGAKAKEQERAELDKKRSSLEEELEQLRRSMDNLSGEASRLSGEATEKSASLTELKVAFSTASASMEAIALRRRAITESKGARKLQWQSFDKLCKDYEKLLHETEARITSLTNTVKGYELRLAGRSRRAEEARQKSERLRLDTDEKERRARLLEELERNLEGFSQSVKAVMKEAGHGVLSGIHGPVSRLIRVPGAYTVAVETAMGAAMQNIVVSEEQDAKRAILLLKQKDKGRATFLPLTTVRGNVLQEKGLEGCPGFVGIAAALCQCEPAYQGVLNSILGRIVVAEDLDSAVAIARRYGYRFRIVTLDGQVVNAGGSLTGGSLARNSGLLSRAVEIEKLHKQALSLREGLEQALREQKTAQEELSAAQAEVAAAKSELSAAQEERFRLSTAMEHTQADRDKMAEEIDSLEKEEAGAAARYAELEKERIGVQKQVERCEAEMVALQEKLSMLSGSRGEQNQQSDALLHAIQESRMQSVALQKDRDALVASVEDIERRKLDHAGRVTALHGEIDQTQAEITTLRNKIHQVMDEAAALRRRGTLQKEEIERLNQRRMEFDRRSTELRAQEKEQSDAHEKIGHELARLEERRNNLQKEYDEIISRLWEEYELTRREAEETFEKLADIPAAQKRLNELKIKIRGLGTVNVAAVEEYKEVSERYAFLSAQVQDVEKSRDELNKLIFDLTRQMRELFLERFQQINENFRHTFRDLFGGGTSDLTLNDPENILACGIDIAVQPPGKIVTNLESLSGGEKALVAIALYFAIMKVNPPPFCVLDEIEAALDDVNVNRFAAYLRRMNQNTQFIVITHRRGSMEEADVLYGVTMQDEGVSKLLELRAGEIEQKLGMK